MDSKVLVSACALLARDVHMRAMMRVRGALPTRGVLVYWPASGPTEAEAAKGWRQVPGSIGWIDTDATGQPDGGLPEGAEYAVPGRVIDVGPMTREALTALFVRYTRRIPVLGWFEGGEK